MIALKSFRKITRLLVTVGIVINTVMLVHNVVENNGGIMVLNFVSALALFIALSAFKERDENGK